MNTKILKNFATVAGVVTLSGLVLNQRVLGQQPTPCCLVFPQPNTLDSFITTWPGNISQYPNIFPIPPAAFAVDVTVPGQPIPPGVYGAWCINQSTGLNPAVFGTIPG